MAIFKGVAEMRLTREGTHEAGLKNLNCSIWGNFDVLFGQSEIIDIYMERIGIVRIRSALANFIVQLLLFDNKANQITRDAIALIELFHILVYYSSLKY